MQIGASGWMHGALWWPWGVNATIFVLNQTQDLLARTECSETATSLQSNFQALIMGRKTSVSVLPIVFPTEKDSSVYRPDRMGAFSDCVPVSESLDTAWFCCNYFFGCTRYTNSCLSLDHIACPRSLCCVKLPLWVVFQVGLHGIIEC